MRIIPVLDLLGSQVVRGVAGRRDEYRPVQSRLVAGSDALTVATAIRDKFGLSQFYVADLDAILTRRPNRTILQTLVASRFSLFVDAGIGRSDAAAEFFGLGVEQVVAGLETLEGPDELSRLIDRFGSERVVFSLDLRNGRSMASAVGWPAATPFEIASRAIDAGCSQLIVLDLALVGTGAGVPTLELCDQIRRRFPVVKIVTGGGVRGADDLRTLASAGINGVLIASALHDGSIQPSDLNEFVERPCKPAGSLNRRSNHSPRQGP